MIFIIIKWLFLHLRLATALVEEVLPNITGWPAAIFAICFSIYWYGHSHGVDSCLARQAKIEQNLEKKYEKIKTNTDNLSNNQLDRKLRKWRRD